MQEQIRLHAQMTVSESLASSDDSGVSAVLTALKLVMMEQQDTKAVVTELRRATAGGHDTIKMPWQGALGSKGLIASRRISHASLQVAQRPSVVRLESTTSQPDLLALPSPTTGKAPEIELLPMPERIQRRSPIEASKLQEADEFSKKSGPNTTVETGGPTTPEAMALTTAPESDRSKNRVDTKWALALDKLKDSQLKERERSARERRDGEGGTYESPSRGRREMVRASAENLATVSHHLECGEHLNDTLRRPNPRRPWGTSGMQQLAVTVRLLSQPLDSLPLLPRQSDPGPQESP